MANLNTNIFVLFGISAVLAFFFPLVRDKVFKELSLKPLLTSIVPFLATVVPFGALYGLSAFLGTSINVSLPCFLGAATLMFVLSRIGLPAPLRGVLLLAASVGWVVLSGDNMTAGLPSLMLGIVAMKLTDNLFLAEKSTYDDVVAPLALLGAVQWSSLHVEHPTWTTNGYIVLGTISVCLLLRVFQRPFMTDDRWLLKRIILSATGGLGVLLVINKLLLQTDMSHLALLVGGGMFATYLFQNVDAEGEDKVTASTAIQELIVIGVLTLVAARFFGTLGMLVLIPAAILPVRGGVAQYIGLFFLSRVLLQAFVVAYNSNVTGINLTHAYTSAALYAGFIIMAILFMLLRELTDQRIRLAVFLAAGLLVPMGANFYLHAEPTSSLLVAATVAGVMFACLGPALQKSETPLGFGNLLLMPTMMSVAGITFGTLIDSGVSASNEVRLGIIGGALALAIIATLISWYISRQGGGTKKPVAAASE
jgi:hypothetical protein